jgi:alkylation response protein AidB-like acyl-CoA dehydrogenase
LLPGARPPRAPPPRGPRQASTVIVYAKTAPEKGPHGITAFIVEKGMKARAGSGVRG